MKLLLAPFIKLWSWIKETAWIQPLLIVGVVFAVIFSISPIISAVQGASTDENSTQAFYKAYRSSLEGVIGTGDDKEDKSAAGKLFANLIEAATQTDENKKAAAVKALPAEKFFLSFYKSDCSGCNDAKKGFDTLQKNWKSGYYVPSDNKDFKLVTIQVDEDVTDATTKVTGFDKLLTRYSTFFEISASNIYETAYYTNGKVDDTSLEYFGTPDSANFVSPTVCLVDFTDNSLNGVSELLFSVPGQNGESGDNARARTLIDCWNGTGDFEIK